MIKRLLLKNNQGATAIEAALVLPVFLLFILGMISLGHALMIRHTMFYALDVASRQVLISPSTSNDDLRTLALARMTSINTDEVIVSVNDNTSGGANSKIFNATYTYELPNIIGLSPINLSANVTVRVN